MSISKLLDLFLSPGEYKELGIIEVMYWKKRKREEMKEVSA